MRFQHRRQRRHHHQQRRRHTFFDNSNGGNAQFITNGTGYVDFSGSIGPNGDGRITAGSIAGSGTYYIGAGNTLIVGGNNLSTEVSGVIADSIRAAAAPGPGALEKVGTGTMILSGINTYTGTTTVIGGVLDVEGSIAVVPASPLVNANATLTGTGTSRQHHHRNGGTFAPGNGRSGCSMTVAGQSRVHGGVVLWWTISAPRRLRQRDGHGDAGRHSSGRPSARQPYVAAIHHPDRAGGRSGTFNSPGQGHRHQRPLVATPQLRPDTCLPEFALELSIAPGLNVNQQNVGNALTNFFNANGGIPAAFATLTPAGLTQVSGETATGSQQTTFDAMNLFLGVMTDPFIDGAATA